MKDEIGRQLRQAREARKLNLEQIARETRMRLHYLQALENGDFDALPSKAQARGFLRTYAGYLHVEAEPLLAALDGAKNLPVVSSTPDPINQTQDGESPPQSAEIIFVEIGQTLLRQRELLGLSLNDVVRHTHLRRHYLEALETGNMTGLPSPVQGRGMLKNYAAFLGMDPEVLLLRFADGLQERLKVRQTSSPTEAAIDRPEEATSDHLGVARKRKVPIRWRLPAPLRRMLSSDFLIGGTLTLFMIGFVIWGAIRIFTLRSGQVDSPTAPSVADVLLAPATETPTATVASEVPTDQVAAGAALGEAVSTQTAAATVGVTGTPGETQGVQVYVTVRQRAWIQVTVDGRIEFQGRVLPGSAYSFAGDEWVGVLTGNASALQIFFNQQDLGPMGQFGQVVHQIFTLDGMMTPTPTITLTATPTPRYTPTPSPTSTLQPGAPPPVTVTVPPLP